LAAYRYYQELVVEVDQEIKLQLSELKTAATAEATTPARTKASPYQRRQYEPKTFDLRGELYRIFGVDLTNVPGSAQSLPKPSCVRLVRMSPDSETPLLSHPGSDSVPRRRSAVVKFSSPKANVSEAG
jgi:hypothetical protein